MEGSQETKVINFEKSIVFSDSIILISKEINDIKHINNFILSCISLMEKSTSNDFPLRGSIGKGDFIYDDEDDIFLSSDFAKIYNFEGQQEWCGCTILEDTQDIVKNAIFGMTEINNKQSLPLLKYSVPLKNKKKKELMCLNFYYMQSKYEHLKLLDYLKGDNTKQINTKDFFDFIETLENDAQILSEEYRPAIKLKSFGTRTSNRFQFVDENNNSIIPKVKCRIEFYEDKSAKAILLYK